MNFAKLTSSFRKEEKIASITVHETALRASFLQDKGKGKFVLVYTKTVPLETGTVFRGEIKNPKAFLTALAQLDDLKKITTDIILSIPDVIAYTRLVKAPLKTPKKRIPGIVASELESHSPIPLKRAYYDWEATPKTNTKTEQLFLVAVGAKKKIDPFILIFGKQGYHVVAIETHVHSVRRILSATGSLFLIMTTSSEIQTSVIHNGLVVFQHAVSIQKKGGGGSLELLKEKISGEVTRVAEFYLSEHPTEKITSFALIEENPLAGLENILAKTLSLKPVALTPKISLTGGDEESLRDPKNLVMLGAAVRGTIPRSKDTRISLAPLGTEELFRQSQIIFVGHIVSDFIIIFSVIFVLVFSSSWAFLTFFQKKQAEEKLESTQILTQRNEYLRIVKELEVDIAKFNEKVSARNQLYAETPDWSVAIGDIMARVQPGITLNTISLVRRSENVVIQGTAATIGDLIDFKNVLSFSGLYETDLKIPLQSFELEGNIPFTYELPLRNVNDLYPYFFYESLQESDF